MLPGKLLEKVIAYKWQEYRHANALREAIPGLEPPYVELLRQWETALGKTLEAAQFEAQEQAANQVQGTYAQATASEARLRNLIGEAMLQSREFSKHLLLMQSGSEAVRRQGVDIRLADAGDASGADDDGYGTGPEPADMPRRTGRAKTAPPAQNQTPAAQQAVQPGVPAVSGAGGAPVPIGGHKLPPLPYAYNALEPYIDETTMRIHHDKHHQTYVDDLNKAELKLAEARRKNDFELVKHWERELAFNGAGHYLHTIFWDVMAPGAGGKPTGPLADQIARDFGSFDAFKRQFSEAAGKVEGGGWAILVWGPRAHRLEILTAEKHQNLSQWDNVPILPLDVWEHAYYLKHQNKRADYVKDWWNVVNWPYAAARFEEARKLKWQPF
ncbi:Fe-Mn family superoxide dismutase [Cohnella sp. 56]|uniref:Fe-Mn family superoxide dismutase n=1 Tax=Cohnella sp. 56 TaxID=3113722 RepID=UPI0030E8249A